LGVDETGLYPPHISVTGFFHAKPQQAANVCRALVGLIQARSQQDGLRAEVRGVVSTDDGYVILDVFAPGVAELAAALTAQVAPFGVRLRPKSVRHLSLGKRKSRPEQEAIARLHADVPLGCCEVDLVVARLVQRSDVPRLQSEGQAHDFREVLRLSLPSGARRAVLGELPARTLSTLDAATPLRKRRPGARFEGQATALECGGADGTPPKVAAARDVPGLEHAKVRRLK